MDHTRFLTQMQFCNKTLSRFLFVQILLQDLPLQHKEKLQWVIFTVIFTFISKWCQRMALVTTGESILRSYKNIFTTVLHVWQEYECAGGIKAQHLHSWHLQTLRKCQSVTQMFKCEQRGKTNCIAASLLEPRSSDHSLGIWFAALARSTAPGLGYGRCWNRGPAAVVSAPVCASLRLGRPLDQVPLKRQISLF